MKKVKLLASLPTIAAVTAAAPIVASCTDSDKEYDSNLTLYANNKKIEGTEQVNTNIQKEYAITAQYKGQEAWIDKIEATSTEPSLVGVEINNQTKTLIVHPRGNVGQTADITVLVKDTNGHKNKQTFTIKLLSEYGLINIKYHGQNFIQETYYTRHGSRFIEPSDFTATYNDGRKAEVYSISCENPEDSHEHVTIEPDPIPRGIEIIPRKAIADTGILVTKIKVSDEYDNFGYIKFYIIIRDSSGMFGFLQRNDKDFEREQTMTVGQTFIYKPEEFTADRIGLEEKAKFNGLEIETSDTAQEYVSVKQIDTLNYIWEIKALKAMSSDRGYITLTLTLRDLEAYLYTVELKISVSNVQE